MRGSLKHAYTCVSFVSTFLYSQFEHFSTCGRLGRGERVKWKFTVNRRVNIRRLIKKKAFAKQSQLNSFFALISFRMTFDRPSFFINPLFDSGVVLCIRVSVVSRYSFLLSISSSLDLFRKQFKQ